MTTANPFGEFRTHTGLVDDIFDSDEQTLTGVGPQILGCHKLDANTIEFGHVIAQKQIVGARAPLEVIELAHSEIAAGASQMAAWSDAQLTGNKFKNQDTVDEL